MMLFPENFRTNSSLSATVYHRSHDKSIRFSYSDLWNASTIIKQVILRRNLSNHYFGVALLHSPALIAVICGINLADSAFCCLKSFDGNSKPLTNYLKRLRTKYCFCYKQLVPKNCAKVQGVFDVLGDQVVLLEFDFDTTSFEAEFKIAYCVLTSGSTGEPKLVKVPEACILPNLERMEAIFQFQETDRIFVSSPPTFDPFVLDVFLALRNGACLILVSNEIRLSAELLQDVLFRQDEVTFMQMTPSLFTRWSEEAIKNVILHEKSSLRYLVLGGEPFPETIKIPEKCPVKVYNIYGITEVSCWSTIEEFTPGLERGVALGSPLDSTTRLQLRHVDTNEIIDTHNSTLPVRGQLFLGSDVRKCVVDDERLEEILHSEYVCYRNTGDLVELIDGGKWYYLGRCDETVKRYGVRVSLARVERVANRYAGISRSVTIFDQARSKLFLFYTSFVDSKDRKALRSFLSEKLEENEIPDDLIRVNDFCYSEHGKVNKKALLKLYTESQETSCNAKQLFCKQLSNVLGISYNEDDARKRPRMDYEFSFMDAGGSSIQAVQIVTELQSRSKLHIPNLVGLLLDKSVPIRDILPILDEPHSAKQSTVDTSAVAMSSNLRYAFSLITQFDMGKCIDASPTVYRSETHNRQIIGVGSHSHQIIIIDHCNNEVITKFVLPDRVESPISYIANGDLGVVGCYDGNLYCFDIWTSEIRWKFDSGGMIKCKALIADSVIIFGNYATEYNLFGINHEGKLIWKMLLGTKGISSSPISLDHGAVFAATLDGSYCCFLSGRGIRKWYGKFDSPVFSTAAYEGTRKIIFVAEVQGVLHCLASQCGTRLWNVSVDGNVFSSPKLLPRSDSLCIIFGCHDGHLYCFNCEDGSSDKARLKWRLNLQSPIYASPSIVNNMVVVCTTVGNVNLIALESFELAGAIKLNGEIFSTPLVVDSSAIYVGCRNNNLYKLGFSGPTS
ncbi:beta-alanine-activating enzyme [Toxorhynchites rutilus septentrionalis]|uniref:beta-alanine-activating enzyme n=1 Tax=Toxorhynchites rutilus septentrionalis TaxID=329112 RepID=UPI00247AA8C9|nr:beta-alanine-activating enzyme [Toxorhynchites rutilus septentrionalis]XP_055637131.1 beta-alanine-activating enzyme [Toxorhynchites rutilus septentrionalis]XP_055637132.1 beta-alanine-activating enzyme [Toxorhynchites rutilus septentrionalis]XP_055637133.1 beta-alanine-activating enzyme [Toxorhynchites rutilus septentrionalis]